MPVRCEDTLTLYQANGYWYRTPPAKSPYRSVEVQCSLWASHAAHPPLVDHHAGPTDDRAAIDWPVALPPTTPFQLRVLAYVDTRSAYPDYCHTMALARHLWPDSPGWRRSGRNAVRGPFMSANAAKHLWRLRDAGLVAAWPSQLRNPTGPDEWRITPLGKLVLAVRTV